MEFIEFKEVYGVFLEGLWRPRQRANCGAVGGANRTPHVHDSFVGGQCGQIVEVWYIGCHPTSRTIFTFSTQTPFRLLKIHNAEPLIVNAALLNAKYKLLVWPPRHLSNSLKPLEAKVEGNVVSAGPEYQMAEISLPAAWKWC